MQHNKDSVFVFIPSVDVLNKACFLHIIIIIIMCQKKQSIHSNSRVKWAIKKKNYSSTQASFPWWELTTHTLRQTVKPNYSFLFPLIFLCSFDSNKMISMDSLCSRCHLSIDCFIYIYIYIYIKYSYQVCVKLRANPIRI
jgi:hypothetical protein